MQDIRKPAEAQQPELAKELTGYNPYQGMPVGTASPRAPRKGYGAIAAGQDVEEQACGFGKSLRNTTLMCIHLTARLCSTTRRHLPRTSWPHRQLHCWPSPQLTMARVEDMEVAAQQQVLGQRHKELKRPLQYRLEVCGLPRMLFLA